MRARFAPLRRLGAILCGVLMMHTSWMAATAMCDGLARHQGTASREVLASPTTDAHANDHAREQAHHHGPATDTPAPHHDAPRASCPMAMACTLSVISANLPTIVALTVVHTAAVPTVVADAPHWALVAPEPPPPRG